MTYPHTIQSDLLDIRASPNIIWSNLCGSHANLTAIMACATCPPQENIMHGSRNLHELACDLEIYCSIEARLEGIDIVIEGIVTYPHAIQSDMLDIWASPHIIWSNL